ncbi:MAG TPA: BrnT family toxin [Gemmatimonadales bacterium]|nr:BrnT family toxin [Gemmatimonadales bacterium]
MSELRFAWDPVKAAANRRKHGVSFEEAQTVFSDEYALLLDDPDHSAAEDRFILLGLSAALRILVVVHCYRVQDDVIRIISARRATRHERESYARRWQP